MKDPVDPYQLIVVHWWSRDLINTLHPALILVFLGFSPSRCSHAIGLFERCRNGPEAHCSGLRISLILQRRESMLAPLVPAGSEWERYCGSR